MSQPPPRSADVAVAVAHDGRIFDRNHVVLVVRFWRDQGKAQHHGAQANTPLRRIIGRESRHAAIGRNLSY